MVDQGRHVPRIPSSFTIGSSCTKSPSIHPRSSLVECTTATQRCPSLRSGKTASKTMTPSDSSTPSFGTGNGFSGDVLGISFRVDGCNSSQEGREEMSYGSPAKEEHKKKAADNEDG